MNEEKQNFDQAAPAADRDPGSQPSVQEAQTPAPACPQPPGQGPDPANTPQTPPDASTARKEYRCPDGWTEHPTDPRFWFKVETGQKWPKHLPDRGWQKGQSGNPSGRRKKEKCLPDLLRWAQSHTCPPELLEKMTKVFGLKGKREKITVEQAIALRVCMEALNGDIGAIKFIAERTEGKALQHMILDSHTDGPLVQLVAAAPVQAPQAPHASREPDK